MVHPDIKFFGKEIKVKLTPNGFLLLPLLPSRVDGPAMLSDLLLGHEGLGANLAAERLLASMDGS